MDNSIEQYAKKTVQDLILEQINVNSEITSRLKTAEQMIEHLVKLNADDASYKNICLVLLDVFKGKR